MMPGNRLDNQGANSSEAEKASEDKKRDPLFLLKRGLFIL
jgi:hypothetical protein